jgi:uncharacterized protein (TIGR02266 family)
MTATQELRECPRADIRWPVTIETDDGPLKAETSNLSAGGAYIRCNQTPEEGEVVNLTVRLPNGAPLKITAQVTWAGEILPLGMGVRFLDISEEGKQLIAAEVEDHLRLEKKELELVDADEILILE